MTNQFKTTKFQQLRLKWYKKLAREGFVDIEQDEHNLKAWESTLAKYRYTSKRFTSTEKYYQLAGQFLNSYKFETKKDRRVWELHSGGLSERKLAKKMRVSYGGNINTVIKRLRKIMLTQYNDD